MQGIRDWTLKLGNSRLTGQRYIIRLLRLFAISGKEVPTVVRCPKCAVEIDVDEDEVEEGEILNCPECEAELEVVQTHPVRVNVISDDDDDADEDDDDDDDETDDAELPEDVLEDEEEEAE